MKSQVCIDLRYRGNDAVIVFEFNPHDAPVWDLSFAEGDSFVDVASGRHFVLRFEEVKCVDC